jgi:hypothetical protein
MRRFSVRFERLSAVKFGAAFLAAWRSGTSAAGLSVSLAAFGVGKGFATMGTCALRQRFNANAVDTEMFDSVAAATEFTRAQQATKTFYINLKINDTKKFLTPKTICMQLGKCHKLTSGYLQRI